MVRDLLVLSVDPSRIDDPEIAAETERERLMQLAARFSREDLLRAFDVLSKAESDIRGAAQPRYHLEMALLRWIHLRKLVPLTELLERHVGDRRSVHRRIGERPVVKRRPPRRCDGDRASRPRRRQRPRKPVAPARQATSRRRAGRSERPPPTADRRSPSRRSRRRWTPRASAFLDEIQASRRCFSTTPSWRRRRKSSSGPTA